MLDIHHVGSTSVPAIGYAKPIIDILILVWDLENVSLHDESMIQAGYRVRGENGLPGRRYFTKGDFPRTHHVHIYQKDDVRIYTYLDFKQYLLEHLDDAVQYGRLKLKILECFPHEQYQPEKEKRMDQFVNKALKWGEENRRRN